MIKIKRIFYSAAVLVLGLVIKVQASNEVINIMNLPTCQTTGKGIVLFEVGHRYLDANRHTTNISISFGYGFTDRLDAYTAYSFKNKDIVLSGKATILNDFTSDDLFSIALVAGGGYKDTNQINNSISTSYAGKEKVQSSSILETKDRPSYFAQIAFHKHLFDNKWGLGVVPMYAHNTNFYGIESKDDYSAGFGLSTEIYFFDRVALCGETVFNAYGFAFKYANYNAGIKYAGYRHTFTLWIGNSPGYSPVEYIVGSTVTSPKISFDFTREFDI